MPQLESPKVIFEKNADDQLPSQTNNSGKFLTTNGTTASWETISLESLTDTEVNAIFDAAVPLTNASLQEY